MLGEDIGVIGAAYRVLPLYEKLKQQILYALQGRCLLIFFDNMSFKIMASSLI